MSIDVDRTVKLFQIVEHCIDHGTNLSYVQAWAMNELLVLNAAVRSGVMAAIPTESVEGTLDDPQAEAPPEATPPVPPSNPTIADRRI